MPVPAVDLDVLSDFTLYEVLFESGTMLGASLVALRDRSPDPQPVDGERVTLERTRSMVDPSDRAAQIRLIREWNRRRDEVEAVLAAGDDGVLADRWDKLIRPVVFADAVPSSSPVTVFLGGQPAAGKTSGQSLARRLHPGLVAVIGDDYRQYSPLYRGALDTVPLDMPQLTARAAATWTGMTVTYADQHGIPILVEGTWRDESVVLAEAARAKHRGRRTHAIVMATPPLVSRAGMIDRFASKLLLGEPARWTPPTAHEHTIRALRHTVPMIAASRLIDTFTVTDRTGTNLITATGDDKPHAATIWRDRFDRPLTDMEHMLVADTIRRARQALELLDLDPGTTEALHREIERLDTDNNA